MIKERSLTQKLDCLLLILSKVVPRRLDDDTPLKLSQELLNEANKDEPEQFPSYVSNADFKLMLKKLEDDKYITTTNSMISCAITFEGKLFIQNGGYSQRKKLENANINRADRLEEFQKRQAELQEKISGKQTYLMEKQTDIQERQTWLAGIQTEQSKKLTKLTKWIFFATAAAGIYYILEIILEIFRLFHSKN